MIRNKSLPVGFSGKSKCRDWADGLARSLNSINPIISIVFETSKRLSSSTYGRGAGHKEILEDNCPHFSTPLYCTKSLAHSFATALLQP